MNRFRCHARRLAGLLAGLAGTLLALSVGAPAAFASGLSTPDPAGGYRATIASRSSAPAGVHALRTGLPCAPTCQPGVASRLEGLTPLPPHGPDPAVLAHLHAAGVGGMPGWQITLIAIGAALVAATLAVLLDRAITARRRASPTTA